MKGEITAQLVRDSNLPEDVKKMLLHILNEYVKMAEKDEQID